MKNVSDVIKLKQIFMAELQQRLATAKQLLKDERFLRLLGEVKHQPVKQRQVYGQAVNDLRTYLKSQTTQATTARPTPKQYLDVTAPWDLNQAGLPPLPALELGSMHPICQIQATLLQIFERMGFEVVESRQLDNEFYMFDSLNFPPQHPARDEFDTFFLKEKDPQGRPLLAPSHTSIMQNRILRTKKSDLDRQQALAVVVPGRVFRNEDVDATHDHMFYQMEGIYVSRQATVANLIATLQTAMSAYFGLTLEAKIQSSYFPFTEPSFEFAISCPFCRGQKTTGCRVCSDGWVEVLGCGMVHPNVLRLGEIDPQIYSGFAWGLGLNRFAMIGHEIEDIRHFASGKLEFLRQFRYEN